MHHYNTPNTTTYVSSENLHTELEANGAKTGKRKLGPGATRVPPRATGAPWEGAGQEQEQEQELNK